VALRWYRDTFAPNHSYTELMDGNRSLLGAVAFSTPPIRRTQSTPRSRYRGAWVNLSLAHTRAELIRAVLEGVAFSLRAALEVISEITPVHQL